MIRRIKKTLKDSARGVVGNRVTLISSLLMLAGFGLDLDVLRKTHNSPIEQNTSQASTAYFRGIPISTPVYYENYRNPPLGTKLEFALGSALFLIGGCAASVTAFGESTRRFYEETKEHITQRGKLEPRYMRKLIERSENGSLIGYCQLQGAYLAAREANQLEVFNEIKKQYSNNKLPNF